MAVRQLADRIKETTAVTGTGTATLLGASTGFRSFSVFADGDTVYYVIVAQTPGEWEVGLGTVGGSGTTLARTQIISSTNANNAVNFSAGTKDVFVDLPSSVSPNALDYLALTGGTLSGHLLFSADNTYDLGASGATRPRTGYFGTSIYLGASGQIVGGTNIVELRGSAQKLLIDEFWTDAINYSRLSISAPAGGPITFASEAAGTGTARPFTFTGGHVRFTADNTWDIGASGATRPRNVYVASALYAGTVVGTYLQYESFGYSVATADGVWTFSNNAGNDFGRLRFGGNTASYPALKRSSTILQARLADDSAFAPLQGLLRTAANAATETITPDKTLTLYDGAGTAYKVPCVAA